MVQARNPAGDVRRRCLGRSLLGRGVPRSSGALRRIVAQRERVKGHRGESRVVASSESGQKSSRVFFFDSRARDAGRRAHTGRPGSRGTAEGARRTGGAD